MVFFEGSENYKMTKETPLKERLENRIEDIENARADLNEMGNLSVEQLNEFNTEITTLKEVSEHIKEAVARLKKFVEECEDCPGRCTGCLEDIKNESEIIFGRFEK